ncbi:hypothetical protein [Pseudanabaena sp. 'Roaring Creek']|uniref:hypothetical protein n=1 Tax=Pseudanabaena sp. 'Roaring Creek' TaxID=1681830 RepID=UPI0006D77D58|nr:hypothetical protein [Pseudanabaena sp. 'Roaring Creek']
MSTKKEPRYIEIVTGAEMKLSLDPDIYNSEITLILGVSSAAPAATAKIVPLTLKQAGASTAASILDCTVEKGTGTDTESRVVQLIAKADNVAAAKTALIDKTLALGGSSTSNWTIKSVTTGKYKRKK